MGKLGDKILDKAFGSKSNRVTPEEMLELIKKYFIQPGDDDTKAQVMKALKGSLWSHMLIGSTLVQYKVISKDGRYRLQVLPRPRSGYGRTVFIVDESVNENWELKKRTNYYKLKKLSKSLANVQAGVGSIEPTNANKTQVEKQDSFDNIEKLKKYKELLDSGVITQEDYDKKKTELL